MNEYIRIRHFGPIVDVELDHIAQLTLLVGESGSGKSTVMKLLSMFRWIYKRVVLRSYVKQADINDNGIRFDFQALLRTSGLEEYRDKKNTETEIIYRRGEYEIAYRNGKLDATITISPKDLSLEKICFLSDKRVILPDLVDNKFNRKNANYYLEDTMENFLLAQGVIEEFPVDYLGVKFKVEKSGSAAKYKVMGENQDNQPYNVSLKNASSGMQNVIPMSLIVEYYSRYFDPKKSMDTSLFQYLQAGDRLKYFNTAQNIGEIEQKNVHILIEEPELSLYPDNQASLMDFLVERCFRTDHPYNMTLMMATHSPYLVNYLNLLMKRLVKGEQTKACMDPDKVDVYAIMDGTAVSLKMKTAQGDTIIDARLMSDPIAEMYTEYNN